MSTKDTKTNLIVVGSTAPDFSAPLLYDGQEGTFTLSAYISQKKKIILAFYPKDNTPGCTKEMCAFRDDYSQFADRKTLVFGISKDSMASHKKFSEKFEFGALPLISDPELHVAGLYGVGIDRPKRTLFVIDEAQRVIRIIEKMPSNQELLAYVS